MELPRPSSIAWAGIIVGVAAYDYLCPEGELLSERVDAGLENNRLITNLAIGTVALHLLNVLPPKLDPLHIISQLKTPRQ